MDSNILLLLETSKEKNTNFEFDQYDTYAWYLTLGAISQREFEQLLPWTVADVE